MSWYLVRLRFISLIPVWPDVTSLIDINLAFAMGFSAICVRSY